jgi:hypothetical protein
MPWSARKAGAQRVTTTLRLVHADIDGSGDDQGPGSDADADPDPLWPFGDEVATALLGLLEVELRRRGRRWRVTGRDRLELAAGDAPWPGDPLDLRPLRARMDRCAKADWPELVEQYVRELISASTAWLRARGPLRSRILPADAAAAHEPGTFWRTVADGLVEAVVTEEPVPVAAAESERAVATLPRPHAGGELLTAADAVGWGVGQDAVFAAARDNVRAAGRLDLERFTLHGTDLIALFGPTHYAATHVLWLDDYLTGIDGWTEANGALVVLPHRHLVAVYPIESAAVVPAAGTLLHFAAQQFETCPGPISDQLYWWQDGVLSRLPSDSVGETLQLFPTERFAALLDRLRAA